MATLADSPVWINKMKTRFNSLDLNKDGIADENDVLQIARITAKHAQVSSDDEQKFLEKLKRSSAYGIIAVNPNGVTVDEYVEGMKKFVNLPDAKERMNELADIIFSLVDINPKNGGISFEEFFEHMRMIKMEENMIKLIFEVSNLNKDDVIDPEELRTMFRRLYLTEERIEKAF